jgi:hypothetical protein
VRRLRGMLGGYTVTERKERQERSRQQLERTGTDPARPGAEQRNPPRLTGCSAVARQKAQEVDLLADLRHQREHHRSRGAEQQQIKMAGRVAMLAGKASPFGKGVRIGIGDRCKGQDVENDPERLRPELEAADQGDAVGAE